MKLAGIPTLVRKFVRETWAFGPLSAARKSVKGVGSRSGLASIEQFDMLVSVIQSLEDEVSSRRQEEARLRLAMDAIRETTASAIQTLGDEISARGQEVARVREQTSAIQGDLASARATLAALESQRTSEATFVDASEFRALTSRLDTDAAGIHSALAVQSEAIGWLAEHHWTTGPLNSPVAAPIAAPLVSVILPVWNRADLVVEAIKSVQLQIYTNWELIVVDDGSTDQSGEKIAQFLEDKRIQYLRIPHQGVSAARNVGLANSRGDLIAYLDSDDLWYPAFLARMVEAFERAPDRDWAYAAKLFSNELDGTRRIFHLQAERTSLLHDNVVPLTALMHRRCLYEQGRWLRRGIETVRGLGFGAEVHGPLGTSYRVSAGRAISDGHLAAH